jgi:hypothetical protein
MLIIDNEIPLASTVRFVQGVYFALKRRGLNNKGIALVLVFKGKNKGKRSFLWQQTCGKCRKTKGFQRIG